MAHVGIQVLVYLNCFLHYRKTISQLSFKNRGTQAEYPIQQKLFSFLCFSLIHVLRKVSQNKRICKIILIEITAKHSMMQLYEILYYVF